MGMFINVGAQGNWLRNAGELWTQIWKVGQSSLSLRIGVDVNVLGGRVGKHFNTKTIG
jgi:hypothetical protein